MRGNLKKDVLVQDTDMTQKRMTRKMKSTSIIFK